MDLDSDLRACAPSSLVGARAIAHEAVQLPTMAARANLKSSPDDSHSNLGWDGSSKRFLSQPIPIDGGVMMIGLSLFPMHLDVVRDTETNAKFDMNRRSFEDTLQAWFDLAQTVQSGFVKNHADVKPGPSAVRCWPHYFDIATYVQLEAGNAETARGIGVGMSPGDESYRQPYFYVNPWPHLDAADLPDAPDPGHWHTNGYVGAVATAEQILSLDDIPSSLLSFIESAFSVGRVRLYA